MGPNLWCGGGEGVCGCGIAESKEFQNWCVFVGGPKERRMRGVSESLEKARPVSQEHSDIFLFFVSRERKPPRLTLRREISSFLKIIRRPLLSSKRKQFKI